MFQTNFGLIIGYTSMMIHIYKDLSQ